MKVIVTGGAGFIGSHLVDKLLNEKKIQQILVLDNLKDGVKKNLSKSLNNSKVKLIKTDIRNYNSIKNYFKNINVVFHLAAVADIVPSIEDPREYFESNVIGTFNVLEASKKSNVKKFIYAASSSCYGIPKKYPTNENAEINPKYPYALTKFLGESLVEHWSKVYKMNFISLRLFNVYGTRSRTTGAYGAVMGVFLKQKLSNKPLTVVGTGKQKRDFINVTDVADAFIKAMNSKKNNEIINIGASKPISVMKLVKMISNKFTKIPKRPGEPFITWSDNTKAKNILKWKPKISFEVGIGELIKNINYWKNAPLWNKKSISKATKNWFKYLK